MQKLHKLLLRRMPGQWNHSFWGQGLERTCTTYRQHPLSTSLSCGHHKDILKHLTCQVYQHPWGSSLPRLYHCPWEWTQDVKRHSWFTKPLPNTIPTAQEETKRKTSLKAIHSTYHTSTTRYSLSGCNTFLYKQKHCCVMASTLHVM